MTNKQTNKKKSRAVSKATRTRVSRCIGTERARGVKASQAAAICYSEARARGAKISKPRRTNVRRTVRNPSSTQSRAIEVAEKAFYDFSGHNVSTQQKIVKPRIPDVMWMLGELIAVEYRAKRDGKVEHYRHPFRAASRPALAVSGDGTLLLILGGRYRITEAGIEDR